MLQRERARMDGIRAESNLTKFEVRNLKPLANPDTFPGPSQAHQLLIRYGTPLLTPSSLTNQTQKRKKYKLAQVMEF